MRGPALPRARDGVRPLVVFFVLVGHRGLLLTLGTKTPLGHLLVHLPLYGGERLQNRNAARLRLANALRRALRRLPPRRDLLPAKGTVAGGRMQSGCAGHPLERRPARALAAHVPSVGDRSALVLYAMVRPIESLWHRIGVTGTHPALNTVPSSPITSP